MKTEIPDTERIRLFKSTGMSEEGAVRKLASMKRAPEKKSKSKMGGADVAPSTSSREDYPYGLRIDLDNEGLDKLGLTEMPKVGTTVKLSAKAVVKRTSHDESDEGEGESKPRKSVCLQITHLSVD